MKNWYALYLQPRKEKVVEIELKKRGYDVYLPIRRELRQWKDRKRWVETPLINSYIFTNIEEREIWDIVRISGCVKFIWFNGKPAAIPYHQIDSIKLLLEKEVAIEFENNIAFSKGERVMIKEGPFSGLVGLIKHKGDKNNFAVRIDSLGIDLTITLDKDNLNSVEKIEN